MPKPTIHDVESWKTMNYKIVFGLIAAVPASIVWYFSLPLPTFVPLLLFTILPVFGVTMLFACRIQNPRPKPNMSDYIEFSGPSAQRKYGHGPVSFESLYEAYIKGDINFKGDLLQTLWRRYEFANFNFTWRHLVFFPCKWIPEVLTHNRRMDDEQVTVNYDRGNDFYAAFLGPRMVYTSGIKFSESDTLEDMQDNKIDLILNKINLKKGHRLLDIGCGWGTLAVRAAHGYGADVTGVTLAQRQVEHGMASARAHGVESLVHLLRLDYRDIPRKSYDRITCLEMAEHVGLKNFQKFLVQVRDMLDDDGIFYIQVAGLRRPWQGLFMAKYVFPGADASTPLAWYVAQLEDAGFEVQSVDNVGIHYSRTINFWYDNWVKNEAPMRAKYGDEWYRLWKLFLAWSTIISSQGSATCWQIVAHKNKNAFNRKQFKVRDFDN